MYECIKDLAVEITLVVNIFSVKNTTWSLLDRSRLTREKIFKALSGEFTLKIPPARSNLLFS